MYEEYTDFEEDKPIRVGFANIRADQVVLGDTILFADFDKSTVSPERVTLLELCSGGIRINGMFTLSQNNLVTVLAPDEAITVAVLDV